jgi:hypothetical protein
MASIPTASIGDYFTRLAFVEPYSIASGERALAASFASTNQPSAPAIGALARTGFNVGPNMLANSSVWVDTSKLGGAQTLGPGQAFSWWEWTDERVKTVLGLPSGGMTRRRPKEFDPSNPTRIRTRETSSGTIAAVIGDVARNLVDGGLYVYQGPGVWAASNAAAPDVLTLLGDPRPGDYVSAHIFNVWAAIMMQMTHTHHQAWIAGINSSIPPGQINGLVLLSSTRYSDGFMPTYADAISSLLSKTFPELQEPSYQWPAVGMSTAHFFSVSGLNAWSAAQTRSKIVWRFRVADSSLPSNTTIARSRKITVWAAFTDGMGEFLGLGRDVGTIGIYRPLKEIAPTDLFRPPDEEESEIDATILPEPSNPAVRAAGHMVYGQSFFISQWNVAGGFVYTAS